MRDALSHGAVLYSISKLSLSQDWLMMRGVKKSGFWNTQDCLEHGLVNARGRPMATERLDKSRQSCVMDKTAQGFCPDFKIRFSEPFPSANVFIYRSPSSLLSHQSIRTSSPPRDSYKNPCPCLFQLARYACPCALPKSDSFLFWDTKHVLP